MEWRTENQKLVEQITLTRQLGTHGFTIFNCAAPEASYIVPLCGEGITRTTTR
ncbi:MAG TPA: hypothetical protein VHV83_17965 [Armatimonadota bacterium]|nr:hypothetical protein [Armatimonadota bacterium]